MSAGVFEISQKATVLVQDQIISKRKNQTFQ
jgi:hypothetical protein